VPPGDHDRNAQPRAAIGNSRPSALLWGRRFIDGRPPAFCEQLQRFCHRWGLSGWVSAAGDPTMPCALITPSAAWSSAGLAANSTESTANRPTRATQALPITGLPQHGPAGWQQVWSSSRADPAGAAVLDHKRCDPGGISITLMAQRIWTHPSSSCPQNGGSPGGGSSRLHPPAFDRQQARPGSGNGPAGQARLRPLPLRRSDGLKPLPVAGGVVWEELPRRSRPIRSRRLASSVAGGSSSSELFVLLAQHCESPAVMAGSENGQLAGHATSPL